MVDMREEENRRLFWKLRCEQLERQLTTLQAELQAEREAHAQLQAKCYDSIPGMSVFDALEAARLHNKAMTEGRDRFCHAVSNIARAIGFAERDAYAPEAVLRKAKELQAEKERLEGELGRLRDQKVTPLNEHTRYILGRPCFVFVQYAEFLRQHGHQIERSAEDEQAYCIHLMLNMYEKHGESWRDEFGKYLQHPTQEPTNGS